MPALSSLLPAVNAGLNVSCAAFLLAGYGFIRRGRIAEHRFCMSTAFVLSVFFLAGYLTHHALHGSTRFAGAGWTRPLYFSILISHTVLAVVIVPLVLRTLCLALKNRFEAHRRIARWTFPLWLYVSATGVVVYWMLYQIRWAKP